ncbi:MAG: Stf0 sulfotransferase, partial [Verrucomicrobiota bacterium]
ENFFAANAIPSHRLAYERLAGEFAATTRALFTALGRPDAIVPVPRLRRQADRISEEMVRRFLTEMRASLGGGRAAEG